MIVVSASEIVLYLSLPLKLIALILAVAVLWAYLWKKLHGIVKDRRSINRPPFSPSQVNLVRERAKGGRGILAFGDTSEPSYAVTEWITHSISMVPANLPRVTIGSEACLQPYSSSLLNISAMGYKTLSRETVLSLGLGAKLGDFAQNVGEDGLCPYHRRHHADLILQLGKGLAGFRRPDGSLDEMAFTAVARDECVKMIEIKISQGAKPGRDRLGTDLASPIDILGFARKLRHLSMGKPIGLKLCVGRREDFQALCQEMLSVGTCVDYIQIDGSEGGTIAATYELLSFVGMPLLDALAFASRTLSETGIREQIKLIASGQIISAYDMFRALALGADLCCSARGMLLALGCTQARLCNTGRCPSGVAAHGFLGRNFLGIREGGRKVARFQKSTLEGLRSLLEAAGLESPSEISPDHIFRRHPDGRLETLAEIYNIPPGLRRDIL